MIPVIELPNGYAVVAVSGGLDSTTLAYRLRAEGRQLTLLGVNYGQRHRVEPTHVGHTADALGARYVQLDLPGLVGLLAGSALTGSRVMVPTGHYADVSMQATVVPNRNALLLDLAVGLAADRPHRRS